MWKRKELKANAKAAFKRNYWYCVLVALLMAAVLGSFACGFDGNVNADGGSASQMAIHISYNAALIAALIRIFVLHPFEVGGKKYFTANASGNAVQSDLLAGFTGNYLRNVVALFLRGLFIALWSLLLVIPGIVKSYSYRLVPFILADNPEMDAMQALKESSRMMKGSKWKAFMLDLSFFGWYLLSALTFGLLAFFYVNPYAEAANAELYLTLRDKQ